LLLVTEEGKHILSWQFRKAEKGHTNQKTPTTTTLRSKGKAKGPPNRLLTRYRAGAFVVIRNLS